MLKWIKNNGADNMKLINFNNKTGDLTVTIN